MTSGRRRLLPEKHRGCGRDPCQRQEGRLRVVRGEDSSGESVDGLAVADAMASVASTIMQAQTMDEALETIVHSALRSVPGVDHASICVLNRDGGFQTIAATDEAAREADEARYPAAAIRFDEEHDHDRSVGFIDSERPRWVEPARPGDDVAVSASMTFLLSSQRRTATTLNLYVGRLDRFDHCARHIARLFATHARLGLARATGERDFRLALRSRKQIGAAVGIVMERYALTERRAFDFLVQVSRTTNTKLRDVASRLVVSTEQTHAGEVGNTDRNGGWSVNRV